MKLQLLLLALCFTVLGRAQTNLEATSQKILTGLQNWYDNYPQEKVFVQTDRDVYAAGQSIWLKAWCTLEGRPSFLSKILYVTLADASGRVVDKKMYSLDSLASSKGVIDIPDTCRTGAYTLNGYTLWMLNFPQYVFTKPLYFYGSDYKQKKQPVKATSARWQVQFFPEGGEAIAGIPNRMAFKATDAKGLPVAISGTVTDGNKTVAEIKTDHDGMGMFEWEPVAGANYVANVKTAEGLTGQINLPAVQSEGITMQVNNTGTSRLFVLLNRAEANKDKYNRLILVANAGGVPVYEGRINFDAGESAASIVKKDLPPGILQITVFDTLGRPLAERLAFINNYKAVTPQVNAITSSKEKRGKNQFNIQLDPVEKGSYTVLVTDAATDSLVLVPDNIMANQLLGSEIRGYIHQPAYYFNTANAHRLSHLDLLLMTQGWRKFSWNQVMGRETVKLQYPVETLLSIRGKVTKSDRPDPVTNGMVSLLIKAEDSTSIVSNAFLTDKGEFIVDSIAFFKKATISYEGTNNNKQKLPVDVTIYPSYIDTLRSTSIMSIGTKNKLGEKEINLPPFIEKSIVVVDTVRGSIMQGVTVKAKRMTEKDSLQKEYVSPMFVNSDQTLTLNTNTNYLNIWQFLNANVAGFNVNPFQPGGVTNAAFSRYQGMAINPDDSEANYIRFFINEIAVSADVVDALNPSDVALIKIYKGPSAFVFGAEAGAISIYTKKGGSVPVIGKAFSKMEKSGFAYTREFFEPNYTAYPDLNKGEKDERLTLYWNPNVTFKNGQPTTVVFHNNDTGKSYRLVVQGITASGKLVYKEIQF